MMGKGSIAFVAHALLSLSSTATGCNDIADGSSEVFVSPAWVRTQLDEDSITLLDARGAGAYDEGHLETAVRAGWQSFTLGCPGTTCGVLSPAADVQAQFASLGVSPSRPVVVYGGWQGGWGDEGRVHWMLKSLGHTQAFILSGGLDAYVAAHGVTLSDVAVTPVPVDVAAWSSGVDTTGYEGVVKVVADIASSDLLIDTRTEDEYDGTLSGEANYNVLRDGHATGAVLYAFSDYFNGACLKTCDEFTAGLTERGWTEGTALVAYCTAGIRSAFFWSVAAHCGVSDVSNFGGSMWQYAADDSLPMTTEATAVGGQSNGDTTSNTTGSGDDSGALRGVGFMTGYFAAALLLIGALQ